MTKLSADSSIEGGMNSFFDKQSTHVTACQKRTVVKSQHSFANKWANKQFILVATYSFVNVKVFEPRFLSIYKCSVYKNNCPHINICLLRAFPVHKYKNIHLYIHTRLLTWHMFLSLKKSKWPCTHKLLIYTKGLEICQGNSVGTASLSGPNLRQASFRSHTEPATQYFAGADGCLDRWRVARVASGPTVPRCPPSQPC